jgi:hypothetical protein
VLRGNFDFDNPLAWRLNCRHNRKDRPMKKLIALVLLGGSLISMGCARPNEVGWTPAYTLKERQQLILRNWDYEGKQINDDIDNALMLRPVSHLTIWNVQ